MKWALVALLHANAKLMNTRINTLLAILRKREEIKNVKH